MRLKLALYVVSCWLAARAASQERASDYGAWFLRTFGRAQVRSDSDRTLMEEATRVFAALDAVAEKKVGRPPRLLIVERNDRLEAQALPDGTIVANLALLRFCYGEDQNDVEQGRARLAFVLGHEMAHLAHHDSWHAEAFSALQHYGDDRLRQETRDWVEESPAVRQAKEIRADEAGFLYLVMAGFNPRAVLGGKVDFLREWSARVQADTFPADGHHPSFDQRSRVLRTRLEDLARTVPFFRFGVRLLQIGRVEDSLALLQYACGEFPSREVQSSLALARFQRAVSRLAECGYGEARRLKLPLGLDPTTLAVRARLRGAASSECDRGAAIREDLDAAERMLVSAVEHDRSYVPAQLNLAAVWLVDGRPLKALDMLRNDRKQGEAAPPQDARILLAEAVAFYLSGPELRIDTTDGALQALDDLESSCRKGVPSCDSGLSAVLLPAIAFDRGRILQERGRPEGARLAFEQFLELEPQGAFASEARESLLKAGASAPVEEPVALAEPALRKGLLDRLPPEARATLRAAARRSFTLGDIRGAFLAASGLEALELRGVVELVELRVPQPGTAPSEIESRLGAPLNRLLLETGRQTLVYRDAAFDVEDGRVISRVLFEPR